MIVISNFYKLILIIILIIILFELVKNFKTGFNIETFYNECEGGNISSVCPIVYSITKVEKQDKEPADIDTNLINLELTISLTQQKILKQIIIIIYINNKGPYFDYIEPRETLYQCPLALKKGVNYKFGVIGIYTDSSTDTPNKELITDVSIKEITVDALNNNYNQKELNNWIQKISCKSNGKHIIVDPTKCGVDTINNSIIAKHSLGDTDTSSELFTDEKHYKLMKELTNKSPSQFNIDLKHNLPT
jgi:hypothetical protein